MSAARSTRRTDARGEIIDVHTGDGRSGAAECAPDGGVPRGPARQSSGRVRWADRRWTGELDGRGAVRDRRRRYVHMRRQRDAAERHERRGSGGGNCRGDAAATDAGTGGPPLVPVRRMRVLRAVRCVAVCRAPRSVHRARMQRRRLGERQREPEAACGGEDPPNQTGAHRPEISAHPLPLSTRGAGSAPRWCTRCPR